MRGGDKMNKQQLDNLLKCVQYSLCQCYESSGEIEVLDSKDQLKDLVDLVYFLQGLGAEDNEWALKDSCMQEIIKGTNI